MKFVLVLILGLFLSFFDYFYILLMFFFLVLLLIFNNGSLLFGGVIFMDPLSFFVVFLSIWIFLFCFLSHFSDKWQKNYSLEFNTYLLVIFFLIFVCFTCFNMIVFYVCFEFIFIIMFIFILGWGYSPERSQASFYMVFYTLVVSFPFLVFLVFMGSHMKSYSFLFLGGSDVLYVLFMLMVFLVKLPVYGAHLWLPKAHVEAPVSGSMVLAGLLLKLGAYGILRFFYFANATFYQFTGYLISLGLIGGLISCFLCIRQTDLKLFVAYSSVVHMSFALGGIFSVALTGVDGTVYMLIAHGFCSSCLFFLLFVYYERIYSRSSLILKGVLYYAPSLSLVWLMLSFFNVGMPPSLPFFSEMLIMFGVSSSGWSVFFFMGALLFSTGLYGMYMYIMVSHGYSFLSGVNFFFNQREMLVFIGHLAPLVYLVFFVRFFFWLMSSSK